MRAGVGSRPAVTASAVFVVLVVRRGRRGSSPPRPRAPGIAPGPAPGPGPRPRGAPPSAPPREPLRKC